MSVATKPTRGLLEDIRAVYKLLDSRYLPRDQKRRNIVWAGLLGGTSVALAILYKSLDRRLRNQQRGTIITTTKQTEKRRQFAVDRVFLQRLWRILKIIIPSIKTKEFVHLLTLTFGLLIRSIISVKIADITGQNAQYLVEQRWDHLVKGILIFTALGLPASIVNSGLEYAKRSLALRFRKSLSDHVNRTYLSGVNFYKATQFVGGENKTVDHTEQRITADVEKFSESLSNLYCTILKPVFDIVIVTLRVSSLVGFRGPFILFGFYAYSYLLKRSFIPAFGKLSARSAELEGDLKMAYQNLISNAEEISFSDGSMKERNLISGLFNEIYHHSSYVQWIKLCVGVFDNFLFKYGSSIMGYAILALPIYFFTPEKKPSVAQLTNSYVRNRQLLLTLSAAVGQLVLLSGKVTTLTGLTTKVGELLEMVSKLDRMGTRPYRIREDPEETEQVNFTLNPYFDSHKWLEEWRIKGEQIRLQREAMRPGLVSAKNNASTEGGTVIEGKFVKFENSSIVSPNGKLLVHNLTFQVRIHENVMVTGPNGSGKSSIFRVLGELWPLYNGILVKPRKEELFFIPQKPYLVLGTLRDQIIYPHSVEDMKNLGVTDDDLTRLLDIVDPVRRILNAYKDKWDEVRDWHSALSGGQKQRVAMARLFYHRPLFAILDECTSMVSGEVETKIYETCKALGITVFTVSHRAQLKKYHDKVLKLDGKGGWELFKVDHSLIDVQEVSGQEEEEEEEEEEDAQEEK